MKRLILFLFLFNSVQSDSSICAIHEVTIPNYPGAYNASFVRFKSGYLMAFRYDRYKIPIDTPFNLPYFMQHIGLVELDANFQAIGTSTLLKRVGFRGYDPRLAYVNGELYLFYSAAPAGATTSVVGSEIRATRVRPCDDTFYVDNPVVLKAPVKKQWEKNWSPFEYKGQLYLSYSVDPHTVLTPCIRNGMCSTLALNDAVVNWPWGIIRGGTPAVLIDDHYLAFFHSSMHDPVSGRYTYYMGAYTFSAEPPFQLLSVSPCPMTHPDFYSTPETPLSHSLVLFPSGLVVDGNRVLVSYGENDGGIKIMELDRATLYETMIDVRSP